jgi:hypothetical protein
MPAMNTTSYPKLIKALREALGTDKLITLSDYEEPTEYFWDTEATGGIAVGEYLDYAWSGYMSEDEDIQLLDPYEMIEDPAIFEGDFGLQITASEHVRKPIAGLGKEKFGHFAVPFFKWNSQYQQESLGFFNLLLWNFAGYKSNNIVVYSDIMSNKQGYYEGQFANIPNSIALVLFEGAFDMTYGYLFDLIGQDEFQAETGLTYKYMLKDW